MATGAMFPNGKKYFQTSFTSSQTTTWSRTATWSTQTTYYRCVTGYDYIFKYNCGDIDTDYPSHTTIGIGDWVYLRNGDDTIDNAGSISSATYYTATVSGSPSTGGTVSGGGNVWEGETTSATATSKTGYYISTINGQAVNKIGTETISGITVSSNITIPVVFSVAPYVKYYRNQTSSDTTIYSTQYFVPGSTTTAPSKTLTNYVFKGWATSRSGAVVYEAEDTITVSANTNLYAVWAAKFTVQFAANGGTGSIANQSFVSGVAQNLTKNNGAITQTRYAFAGWADSAGNKYADGADGSGILTAVSGTAGSTVTLTAQWTYTAFDIKVSKGNTASGATLPSGVGTLKLKLPNASGEVVESDDELEYIGGTAGEKYTLMCEMPETKPSLLYTANGILVGSEYKSTYEFTPSSGDRLELVYKFTAKALYSVSMVLHVYDASGQEIETPSGFSASVTSPAEPDDTTSGKYAEGRAVTITGVPNTGWAMTKAIVNGTGYSNIQNNTFTIPSLAEDSTVHCHFTKIIYLLQVETDAASASALIDVNVDGYESQQATYGDTVVYSVKISDTTKYTLPVFYDGGTCYVGTVDSYDSTHYTYTHTVTGNATLVAKARVMVEFEVSGRDNRSTQTPAADVSSCSISPKTKVLELGDTITYELTLGAIYSGASTNWIFNAWFVGADRTTPLQMEASGEYTPTESISLQAEITTAVIVNTLTVTLQNDEDSFAIVAADAISTYPAADSSSYNSTTGAYTLVFNGTKITQLRAAESVMVGTTTLAFSKFTATNPTVEYEYKDWDLLVTSTSNNSPRSIVAWYGSTGTKTTTLNFTNGGNETMGTFAITDTDDDEGTIAENGLSATIHRGKHITIVATPKNGYKFGGWYTAAAVGGDPYLTETSEELKVGTNLNLYAYFIVDANAVYKWEGSGENKCLEWRSKTYIAARPFNPTCCRVDALGYKVNDNDTLMLKVEMFSSPNAEGNDNTISTLTNIASQSARRLPTKRPEKYLQVYVKNNYEVDAIFVGTKMTEIAQ